MNGLSPANHLLLVIATPLVGAVVAWLMGSRGRAAVRQSAAMTTVLALVAAGWLVIRFLQRPAGLSPAEPFALVEVPWLVEGMFDIRFALGLDGLSLWLFEIGRAHV